jgi:hypothetical protein
VAATQTAYGVVPIGERLAEAGDDSARTPLREDLDIGAFGVSALYQRKPGEHVVRAHHEAGPGGDRHEELYVVLQGSAAFTIDGDILDAPHGTAVFVRDPAAMREAVATAADTIILAVGGPRGTAYRLTPAASQDGFWEAYGAKDYAAALASTKRALAIYPGNAHLLYNVACMEARLGNDEDALAALADSVAKWEPYKELARKDDDFASLREDPRFLALVE